MLHDIGRHVGHFNPCLLSCVLCISDIGKHDFKDSQERVILTRYLGRLLFIYDHFNLLQDLFFNAT